MYHWSQISEKILEYNFCNRLKFSFKSIHTLFDIQNKTQIITKILGLGTRRMIPSHLHTYPLLKQMTYANPCFRTMKPKIKRMRGSILKQMSVSIKCLK